MPQVGKTAQTVTVRRWLKKKGDRVGKGEPLVELESDQGLALGEAASEGTLHGCIVEERQTAAVGAPLAVIQTGKEDAAKEWEQARAEFRSQAVPSLSKTKKAEEKEKEQSMAQPESGQAPKGEVIPILMPQAGNSMEEGTILSWNVKVGDRIDEGGIVAEIETDKSTMEIEAQEGGRVARLLADEGDIVPVKQAIALLAENDADADAYITGQNGGSSPQKAEPATSTPAAPTPAPHAAPPQPAQTSSAGRVKASPAARRIAGEKNRDIAAVGSGSGPYGRILSSDVEQATKSGAAAMAAPAPPPRVSTGQPVRRPMTKMRRAIGKGLSYSKQNLPHWYLRLTIDASPLYHFYKAEKAKYPVSVNDVLVKALAMLCQEFPAFRTQIDQDELVEYPNSNIGVAVGTDEGLVVPVVMGVEQMTLQQLGVESRRIVENARSGKASNSGKGVMTISNLGMFGVEEFSAIINPPEASILAVGAIREDVIVRDGAMKPGRVMSMTLSSDHRIIDGTQGAQFMARLSEVLENPETLAKLSV